MTDGAFSCTGSFNGLSDLLQGDGGVPGFKGEAGFKGERVSLKYNPLTSRC